ncbi:MAG: RsmE family RNA methyltransferase, partial [Leptospira sp.]|nr:RsmE family RNA methyltransferase [Leptospira sp.]
IDNELNLIFLDPRMEKSIGVLNENVIPVIGPEGGFRPEEIQLLKDKNITGYTLGEGILRIETAFLFVASVMKFSEML